MLCRMPHVSVVVAHFFMVALALSPALSSVRHCVKLKDDNSSVYSSVCGRFLVECY